MRTSSWRAAAVSALVALAVLVGLFAVAALAVPTLVMPAQERAYRADLEFLQRAVEARREDSGSGAGRPWPTLDGEVGAPQEGETPGWQCEGSDAGEVCSWIDLAALEDGGYIDGRDRVASADPKRNSTAAGGPGGSYGWFIDSDGAVRSVPPFSRKVGYP